jgi:competence protein ComEC
MDEIKRKLALIDAELHRRSLYAQAIEAAPLLFPAVGLIVGIVGQEILSSQPHIPSPRMLLWFWLALSVFCTAAVAAGYRRMPERWRSPALACGVVVCSVCLGAIRLITFNTAGADDIRQAVGSEQVLATVRGRVVTEPRIGEPNWCFGQLTFEDPPTRFYLSLDARKARDDWSPAAGMVLVRVNEPAPNVRMGDHVTIECWLHRFPPPSNPGQFDTARYLSRLNVYVGAAVESRDSVTVNRHIPPNWPVVACNWMSQMATQALLGGASVDDPDEGLVQALLLGSRQTIDAETYEAFRRTGLLHLVSLSGMNFAMLIVMIWWACRVTGLSKRGRAIVGIIAACVFLMVVPLRPPTLRAAIIVFAYCASILFGRRVRSLNSLCLAAIILLLLQPAQLFDAGWQLSFGCMAGILGLTERLTGLLPNPIPEAASRLHSPRRFVLPLLRRIHAFLVALVSTGLAAWIGGGGILLYHFHTITPLTSLWTALTFPLVWLIMSIGFLQILLAFLLPTASTLLGYLAQAIAHVFIVAVRIMAAPGINLILIGHVGLWVIGFYYGLVLFWRFGRIRRAWLKQGLCVAALLVIVAHLGVLKWQRTHRTDLHLTALDVGHGQAILAQLPGTRNVLFDAGSMYKKDIGSRIVTPFLDYEGIARLDAIVISHGDLDHINGIPEIVEHCRVEHLYATDSFLAAAQTEPAPRLLVDWLQSKGRKLELLPESMNSGPATVRTIWPPTDSSLVQALSDNDRSVVSLIRFNAAGVLLCSDIESWAQRRIMEQTLPSALQVAVAPHHGSTATADPTFIPHFNPRFVVCSCGRREHGTAANQPRSAISEWLHTCLHGAVTIEIDKNGDVKASTWLSHERTGE